MPFTVTQQHADEFRTLGFTVFKRILPTSLIMDLRIVADAARAIARGQNGGQVQRLQPLRDYPIDQRPIQDYIELPELVHAVSTVLSPRHTHSGGAGVLGILFEPAEAAWSTGWHRDWRDSPDVDQSALDAAFLDPLHFNQSNCALFDDSCTWVVAGSHSRLHDTPEEEAHRKMPDLTGLSPVQVEQALVDYCRAMPNAVNLRLESGDFALYRANMWHLGTYQAHQRRATLHDAVDTPEFVAWRKEREGDPARLKALREALREVQCEPAPVG